MINNFTCIIVDDEQDSIELLSSRLEHLYRNIIVLSTYTTWHTALQALRTEKYDILFMDISMHEKNGISLLKLLPGLESEIIFVTAHDNYALDAFSFSATGYILKPIDDVELSFAIDKAIERIKHKKKALQPVVLATPLNKKIGIPNNLGIDYVNINDIMYLESIHKCTKIVTNTGEYTSSHNIGNFQNLIDQHSFFQVHRSYIINLNSIMRYESPLLVIMTNKKEIPISRSVKNNFLKLFNNIFKTI